jgi:arabinofuranosyltransferase
VHDHLVCSKTEGVIIFARLYMMKNKIRLIVISSLIICAGILLYELIRFRYFYHDDEMIALRHLRNFFHHQGLNWNPGEKVEGYTSFLHLFFSAVIIWFTGDFLLAPRIVNFIFFGLMLFSAWRLFKKRFPGADEVRMVLFTMFLLVVVTYPGNIIWIYGGLETVTYTSILFMSISGFLYLPGTLQNRIWSGLLFAMAAMTRPDGILFFGICAAQLFIVSAKGRTWRLFFAFTISFLVVYGCYFVCRYHYYGLLLPNTFYAKTNFTLAKIHSGIRYVMRFALSILFIIGTIGFLFWQNRPSGLLTTRVRLLLLSICIYAGYIIIYGGDHMPGFRFMIPLLPIIALLCAELSSRLPIRDVFIATILLIGNILFIPAFDPVEFSDAKETDTAAFNGALVGNYLNSVLPADQLIATNSAGAIPFFASGHRFIDMLGICDTTISRRKIIPMLASWQQVPGHEKGDGNYVLSRHPDIIILGPSEGTEHTIWFLSDAEILSNPLFKKEYQMQRVHIPVTDLLLRSGVVFRMEPASDSLIFTYYKRRAAN